MPWGAMQGCSNLLPPRCVVEPASVIPKVRKEPQEIYFQVAVVPVYLVDRFGKGVGPADALGEAPVDIIDAPQMQVTASQSCSTRRGAMRRRRWGSNA